MTGLCQVWESSSTRLQLSVSKLLWSRISHWEMCIKLWPWGVVFSSSPCFVCKIWDQKWVVEKIYRWSYWKQGKVIFDFKPHTHISHIKAIADRQTCLGALRYDDFVSTDTVTHTLTAAVPSGKPTCGCKDVHTKTHCLWIFRYLPTTATPAWGRNVATSLWKASAHTNIYTVQSGNASEWNTLSLFCLPCSTFDLKWNVYEGWTF